MADFLAPYAWFVSMMRTAFLGIAALGAVLCAAAWAVRERRVSPFSRLARLVRRWVDPMLAPVERLVLRAGGRPASTPAWAFLMLVVACLLTVTALDMLGGVLLQLAWALQAPARIPVLALSWAFAFLRVALIVRVVASWLPVSPWSRWIRWSLASTEWMLRPLRAIIPSLGPLDITPVVAYFALVLVQGALHIP
jgi:YggT family protein